MPLDSRMLSISDACDATTTNSVYRRPNCRNLKLLVATSVTQQQRFILVCQSRQPQRSVNNRDDEMVARFGRKDFLLLATNCDHATATGRVERIRQAAEHIKQ
ncbi:hypothetical protein N9018_02185 [Rhodopirellula sp.]|nr:hypothetical protein [Rhodopirellula sp.]